MPDLFWSDIRMADGSEPGPNDVVVIEADQHVILDTDAHIEGLVVKGTFEVADTGGDFELETEWAFVGAGGTFQVGTEDEPFTSKFTLTLSGGAPKDPGRDVDLSPYGIDRTVQNNDAFLMAMGPEASIEIHTDDASKESWAQLTQTAERGDEVIELDKPTGWQVGDRIVVASTDFDHNQAEEFTIVAVEDGGRIVTLDRPATFMHYGEADTYDNGERSWTLDMRAEVGLLSRDVKIQGKVDYDDSLSLAEQPDQFGGHTMVMMGGQMRISGAEFTHMGQAGLLGKYPAHWHLNGDVSGQYIENSSFHHTFNKGLTVHGARNARVEDNVTFETIGHSYFLEDGSEVGNQFIDNLGINARRPASRNEATEKSDFNSPSVFWVENAENTFHGNHAAGSDSAGFWFELRGVNGDSRGIDSLEAYESREGPNDFKDNVAHSMPGRAFKLNHAGYIQDGNPIGSPEQPQRVDPWVVEGFTVYKAEGPYVRGIEGTFTESAFAEMGTNARFRLNQTIKDSLIVGRSENTGTPTTPAEIEAGRSLPYGNGTFEGFQLYDGPGGLTNVLFEGFEGDDEAIALSNAIHKTASFAANEIAWGPNVDEASKLSIGGGGNAIGNDSYARGFVDIDGSLTGVPGSMIYQYSSDRDGSRHFNAGENFEVIEEWGAIVTYGQSSGTLRIDDGGADVRNDGANRGNAGTNLSVTRSDGEYASKLRKQIPVFSEYTYTLDFDTINDTFRLYLHDMDWGQSVIFNLGPVPTDSRFTIDDPYSSAAWPAREVSSMAMLEASPDTAVFRDADGAVHIKLVAQMAHGYLWPQPGATYQNGLHSGVTVLVDTAANIDLNTLEFNDPTPDEALPPPPYAPGQGPSDHAESEEDPVEQNSLPLPSDDVGANFSTSADTAFTTPSVLGNDTDPDGDPLSVIGFDDSTLLGTLTDQGDGVFTYDPDGQFDALPAGETATDQFTYTVTDDGGGTASATVTVTVSGIAPAVVVAGMTLAGTPDADTLTGGDGGDTITGFAGDDSLAGGDGADMLFGDLGNDTLTGGHGTDSIDGGNDDDSINGGGGRDVISGGTGMDTISGDGGRDTIFGDAGDDLLSGGRGRDLIDGGYRSDIIYGNGGHDTLLGGAGFDTIHGGDGDDVIDGGHASDLLRGDQGNDVLTGGTGSDTLSGGAGNDTLTGGAHGDRFVLETGFGNDRIVDFTAGVDILDAAATGALFADFDLSEDGLIDAADAGATVAIIGGSGLQLTFDTGSVLLENTLGLAETDTAF
ncbi:MAG: Ig-like domain-containing protein [Alphaproteobacteria bacterium]